ncbi:MAG: CCA tRNA nucleotidyltransferase [Acidobacteria bacterium]|nr:CCA tRNA nucleotidyltransferase [Acidobacteriota bacterium]
MIPPRLEPLLAPDSPTVELSRLFADAGHNLYLVGGTVRDALLDRSSPDLDFATAARPDEIKSIVGSWAHDLYLVGETYGTIGAVHDGAIYEITTFRSEVYRSESRKPKVSFSDTIEEDLSRRDFTVNAMALALPTDATEPYIVDPHGGLVDLAAKTLRTPSSPEVSFGDDPLRMLRLYRFVSTIGFAADPSTVAGVEKMADRLAIVSIERVRAEFDKLIVGEHVGAALDGLVRSRLADVFLPELTALALEQDPVHRHKDVLAHSIAVVEKTSPDLVLRLAALFHDVGKPQTREFGKHGVSFHHHEVVGARLARRRMNEMKYPKRIIRDVSQLVFLHMRPHTFKMGWTDSAVRRYVRDAGELLDSLNELVRCDVTTRNEKLAASISRRIDEMEARITALREREALDAIRPPIDGRDVMEHLGLEPGPEVGEAMKMLLERRLDDGPYSKEEALAMLDEWSSNRG